ncbi:MAG: dephospho-CoA kinase [Bergeyella sp.]|nr:dephospho-CoA kinase [Bergeyella sp.]
MIISLAGYMGSGKTCVARELHKMLGYPLIDLDQEIVKIHHMTIPEIFKTQGEFGFRRAERDILKKTLEKKNNCILSLGGGTPVYYNNIDIINKKSESVYLQASVKTLFERLKKNRETRPLISHIKNENLTEFISKHLFERAPFYHKCRHMVSTDRLSIEEVCKEILEMILK